MSSEANLLFSSEKNVFPKNILDLLAGGERAGELRISSKSIEVNIDPCLSSFPDTDPPKELAEVFDTVGVELILNCELPQRRLSARLLAVDVVKHA